MLQHHSGARVRAHTLCIRNVIGTKSIDIRSSSLFGVRCAASMKNSQTYPPLMLY